MKAKLFVNAADRARTCTVSHWDLNPARLPIPPQPQNESLINLLYFMWHRQFCQRRQRSQELNSGAQQMGPEMHRQRRVQAAPGSVYRN